MHTPDNSSRLHANLLSTSVATLDQNSPPNLVGFQISNYCDKHTLFAPNTSPVFRRSSTHRIDQNPYRRLHRKDSSAIPLLRLCCTEHGATPDSVAFSDQPRACHREGRRCLSSSTSGPSSKLVGIKSSAYKTTSGDLPLLPKKEDLVSAPLGTTSGENLRWPLHRLADAGELGI
ncbi:hypothetical protein U1Q18_000336 [Sarracenia purpurea var. burkii]